MQETHTEHMPSGRRRKSSLKKIITVLILVVLVFAAGVAVGRGNVPVNHLSASGLSTADQLDYSSVNQIYSLLSKDFDGNLDQTKLIDGAKQGLVAATGDPYTEYFNPSDAKTFNNELAGSITGIGAEIGSNSSGDIQVVSPISGYPAEKAGLQPKDKITAINGQTTSGMSVDAAVSKIRGAAGTKVTLTLVRGEGNPFNVTITRQKITVPSVTSSVGTDGIGYLKISQFTDDTVAGAQKAAADLKQKGAKGIVLDLRGNPGGYLNGAVDISSLWLSQGKTIVSERRGSTIVDTEYANATNTLQGLPTVVLIDGGSASASEITAGALHDNGAATLVGQQSFGKGSVQQVINLTDGSELKVTIAHWYTPDGININKKGISPDFAVPAATSAQASAGQDPQLDKAKSILQTKIGG